jgi:hypothetical protein
VTQTIDHVVQLYSKFRTNKDIDISDGDPYVQYKIFKILILTISGFFHNLDEINNVFINNTSLHTST